MKEQTKNEPVIIKAGRGVRAKLWTNNGRHGTWQNVELIRTYKDDNGDLHDVNGFSRDDLPHLIYAAVMAFVRIISDNKSDISQDAE